MNYEKVQKNQQKNHLVVKFFEKNQKQKKHAKYSRSLCWKWIKTSGYDKYYSKKYNRYLAMSMLVNDAKGINVFPLKWDNLKRKETIPSFIVIIVKNREDPKWLWLIFKKIS